MARKQQANRRKATAQRSVNRQLDAELDAREQVIRPRKNAPKAFRPKTERQADYADAIDHNSFTFGIGPAGTGKTYVAAVKAADHLRSVADGSTKIVLTRPAKEAEGETLGFLPGDISEKFGPYMKPLMRVLVERLGEGYVECAVKNGRIEMIPLAFMRGESLSDTLIIADEMQNATEGQFLMLLTRIGEGSRMVIDGDPRQVDPGVDSGLLKAISRLERRGIKDMAVVRFTKSDIVRHDIIQDVIEAYEEPLDA